MAKNKILIADTNINYLESIETIFIKEKFNQINLTVIDDQAYYEEFFQKSQNLDTLVVSEELYNLSGLQAQNIKNVYVLTEEKEMLATGALNVNYIYKYKNITDIYREISLSLSNDTSSREQKKTTRIITLYSPIGGAGNTILSMGLSSFYSRNKKILYIDAETLTTYQEWLQDSSTLPNKVLTLLNTSNNYYETLKGTIKNQGFDYLPPLSSPLVSLGLEKSIYLNLIEKAKEANIYDYIIVDTDNCFDAFKSKLIAMSDRVILTFKQSKSSINKMNVLVNSINLSDKEKFLFICNDYDETKESYANMSNFSIDYYFNHLNDLSKAKMETIANLSDTKGLAILLEAKNG